MGVADHAGMARDTRRSAHTFKQAGVYVEFPFKSRSVVPGNLRDALGVPSLAALLS